VSVRPSKKRAKFFGFAFDGRQFVLRDSFQGTRRLQHLARRLEETQFTLSEKVPAALIPYLGLDDTRPGAIEALINQARSDAQMTNSKCAYADLDPEAALICALFQSAPPRTDPLASRTSPGDASAAVA
jgi:hypothetical protein